MTPATISAQVFVLATAGRGSGRGAATMLGAATHEIHPYPAWLRALIWVGIGFVLLAGYIVACVFWQWKPCRRCKGEGRFRSPSGRAWRHCPRCDGARERLRIGRRIYNYYARGAKDV